MSENAFGSIWIRKAFWYLVVAGTLALAADIPSRLGGVYFASKIFLYLVLFASLLFPLRHSLIVLLIVSICCTDIVQSQTEMFNEGAILLASIWQGGLGPLRPGWFMMAYCIALLLKIRTHFLDRPVAYAMLWFCSVPLITGIVYGGFSSPFASKEVLIDLKLPLFLLGSIILYRNYLRMYPQALPELTAVFVASVLARHLLDFAHWLLGMGSRFGEVNRVSVDSTKGTVVFLLIFAIVLVVRHRRFILGAILGGISALLLVVYSTRGLWLSALIGIAIFLLMIRARRWVIALPFLGILAYGGFEVLTIASPDTVDLVRKRFDRPQGDNLLQTLDANRYAEMLNAADVTLKRWALLWGNGYGSYYTESVMPFPSTMQDAFAEYSLESGLYFTLHHYVLRTLFEHGILGFLVISCLWLIPGWRCFRVFRNPAPAVFPSIMVAIVAFLPTTMLEMYWTGKGMIIGGFVIALCMDAVYEETAQRPRGGENETSAKVRGPEEESGSNRCNERRVTP